MLRAPADAVRRLALAEPPIRVDDPDGGHRLAPGSANIAQVLCENWAPAFDAAPISSAAGDLFLRRWERRVDTDDITFPTRALRGRDSLSPSLSPRPRWPAVQRRHCRSCPPSRRRSSSLSAMRSGHALSAWANRMLQVFLPKGSIDGDELSVTRSAASVRPPLNDASADSGGRPEGAADVNQCEEKRQQRFEDQEEDGRELHSLQDAPQPSVRH